MAYYAEEDFSSNQVAGAIAAASLYDLHLNNFTFDGFPGVQIRRSPFGFSLWLVHGNYKTKPIEVAFTVGKELAGCFQRKEQIPTEWFKQVQELLVELEALTSNGTPGA
jgi:hypothetical protein